MLKGEEDLYFEWTFAYPGKREAPPKGSKFELNVYEYYISEVEKRTKGRLKIEPEWGGGMGKVKEMPQLITSGVIEAGMSPVEIFPDIYPLHGMMTNPMWGIPDLAQDSLLQQYCWNHPFLDEHYAKANQIYGTSICPLPMQPFIRKGVGEITKAEDLEGLQFRSFGYTSSWAEALGMASVFIPGFEVYEAMQKGILDVSCHKEPGIDAHKLYEVSDRMIEFTLYTGAGASGGMTINLDAWNSLPQYIKDIYREVEADATAYAVEYFNYWSEQSLALGKENGMEYYKLSPEENAKLQAAGLASWEDWLADTEKRPGGEKVREYLADCIAFRDKLTGEPWTVFTP